MLTIYMLTVDFFKSDALRMVLCCKGTGRTILQEKYGAQFVYFKSNWLNVQIKSVLLLLPVM